MATPYDYPEPAAKRGPRLTVMSVIAILFAIFMVWQITTTIGDSRDRLAEGAVGEGDEIEYHYVARLPDGTLWKTSRSDVAEAANATDDFELEPAFNYQPKKATIRPSDPGLGWGPDADKAVIGKQVGQTLTFTVPGEFGTGDWEPFTPGQPGIPRQLFPQFFERTVFLQEPQPEKNITGSPGFNMDQLAAQLEDRIGTLEEGAVFNMDREFPPSWDIVFTDVNWDNRSITFRHDVQHEQAFQVPGLPGPVVVVLSENESQLSYRLDLPQGSTFVVQPQGALNQAGFTPGSYKVNAIDDENIDLLYHEGFRPDAVGQPLTVRLTILDKTEGSDAPTGTADDGHTDHTH